MATQVLPATNGRPSPSLADTFVERLAQARVRYCHWKGAAGIARALRGEGDLDLLVDPRDADAFERVASAVGFRRVHSDEVDGVSHHYVFDGRAWIHLHVYTRLVIGRRGDRYALPLETHLLETDEHVAGIPVPPAGACLVALVLRMMLEDTRNWRPRPREYRHREELRQLLGTVTPAAWQRVLIDALPALSLTLFASCVEALSHGSRARGLMLARRVRRRLGTARISDRTPPRLPTHLLPGLARRRRRASKQPEGGGRVIAFVGGDGAGKSTLVAATTAWLGPLFDVRTFHLGKPRLGIAARTVIAMARRVGLGDSISALTLAYARRRIASRAHRLARSGAVVITDRYPSTTPGAMDSPRLALELHPGHGLRAAFAAFEERLYRDIPPPDLVVRVTVPVAVAQQRVLSRGAAPGADAVSERHAPAAEPRFPAAMVYDVDGAAPLERTRGEVQRIVWTVL